MKSVLISIQPKWCELIASGKKTVEVRKTAPKEVPFKVYMYCSKGGYMYRCRFDENRLAIPEVWNGKVIGEFICNKIEKFNVGSLRSDDIEELACLSYTELINYFYKPCELDGKTAKQGYAWHISDLKIYDKPKKLSEFKKLCPIKNKDCPRCEFYSRYEGTCANWLTRPPQSWQYVEE